MGIVLMTEGLLILSCLIPAWHFSDGTWVPIAASGVATLLPGMLLYLRFRRVRTLADRRKAYLLVVLMWVVLALFGMIPFLATGTLSSFSD
ncbi:MAG: hypothetical protein IKS44_06605, partial [Bacteroidales bacterium]|nr:hypothetical protein [Bacteroidales bacterium]